MPRRRRGSRARLPLPDWAALPDASVVPTPKPPKYVPVRGEVVKVAGLHYPVWIDRCEPYELPSFGQGMNGPTGEHTNPHRDALAAGTAHWCHNPESLGGAKNLAEIDAIFQTGWQAGATRARELADSIGVEVPPAQSTRRRREVGKDGTDPIVEAWIDKDLDHLWERRQRTAVQGHKIIQIAVGWGGNYNMTGEQLFWGGAAALILTEMLESAGYGVEVHAYMFCDVGPGHELLDIVVKPSDQPVSPDQFAAVLCHAGVFRSYGIFHIGHGPWQGGSGFGTSRDIDTVATRLVEAGVIPEIEILLPNLYSKQAAINAVREGLRDVSDKYGNPFAE